MECTTCLGHGEVDCEECDSTGLDLDDSGETCEACGGAGSVECDDCSGTGEGI